MIQEQAFTSMDNKEAHLQELRAGAAPLTALVALGGRRPNGTVIYVPVLVTPRAAWEAVTVGDNLSALDQLVARHGGTHVGRRLEPRIRWRTVTGAEPWARCEIRTAGVWCGEFAIAGPAQASADWWWPVSVQGALAFCAQEDAHLLLHEQMPMPWEIFRSRLDLLVSLPSRPSSAVRRLIETQGWTPGPPTVEKINL